MGDLQDIRQKKHPIIINDREYFLHFDYAAYAQLAEIIGINSIDDIKNKLLSGELSVKEEIAIIKCGLMRHHADVDEKEILKIDNMGELYPVVHRAFLQPVLMPEIFLELYKQPKESSEKKSANQTESHGQEIIQ